LNATVVVVVAVAAVLTRDFLLALGVAKAVLVARQLLHHLHP
jgi:uncharacterized membrane protein